MTISIPIETVLAQTFNTELIEKYGNIIGKEMEIFDIHLWLAPAINIHRNILFIHLYNIFLKKEIKKIEDKLKKLCFTFF